MCNCNKKKRFDLEGTKKLALTFKENINEGKKVAIYKTPLKYDFCDYMDFINDETKKQYPLISVI